MTILKNAKRRLAGHGRRSGLAKIRNNSGMLSVARLAESVNGETDAPYRY